MYWKRRSEEQKQHPYRHRVVLQPSAVQDFSYKHDLLGEVSRRKPHLWSH